MKSRFLLLAFLLTYGAAFADFEGPVSDLRQVEQKDREVDTAALDAMKLGARSLISLAERRKNTRQEHDILIKLVETLQKIAAVEFRLAYGPGGKPVQARVAEYHQSLSNIIKAVDRLALKYPTDPFVPRGYLLRGRAHKDLGDPKRAELDFTYVANRWANQEVGAIATLNLCDLLVEQREYQKAIVYLKQLEVKPSRPFHSMVLEHLSWAHYYINDLPNALRYTEKRIAYHDHQKAMKRTDLNDAESAIMNAALFYSKMIEKKVAGASLSGALPYFKSILRGPKLGKVLTRFAFHLRTNNLDSELEEWVRIVANEPAARGEAVDILLVSLENQVNRRRFPQLKLSIDLFPTLLGRAGKIDPTTKNAARARNTLVLAANSLKTTVAEKKRSADLQIYVEMLKEVYSQILVFTPPFDKTVYRLHFNLAEINFEHKTFEAAEQHYRWIVTNAKNIPKEDQALVPRSGLSAISARYETLRKKNLIPTELKPKSYADSKNTQQSDRSFEEWVQWLSAYEAYKVGGDALDVFIFEANRALYAQGRLNDALPRLRSFVDAKPKSQYAIPSASLLLDTYIASSDWEKAYEYSKYLSDKGLGVGAEFGKRLATVTADTYFKMIEILYQKKEYAQVLARSDEFMRKNPKSPKFNDALAIAGNAALGVGDKKRAMTYLALASERAPTAELKATTLATRASLAEEQYDFEQASRAYRNYLDTSKSYLKGNEVVEMKKKILLLAYLTGKASELRSALSTRDICSSELSEECAKYDALATLLDTKEARAMATFKKAQTKMSQSRGSAGGIWSVIALENYRSLGHKDRLALMETVTKSWNSSDPITKYTLLPYISDSLPASFEVSRSEIRKSAPLNKIQKDLIDRRSGMMKNLEEVGNKVAALPWLRIRASVFNEIAHMYFEFGKDLNKLPIPEGLAAADLAEYKKTIADIIAPFEKKAQEFRKTAFEIATSSAIDDANLKAISTAMFAEHPELSRDLRKDWVAEPIQPIGLALIKKADPAGGWDLPKPKSEDLAGVFKFRIGKALANKSWPQIAFLLQEMNAKKALPTNEMGLFKAASLSLAGAQAEGVNELQEVVGAYSEEQREPLYLALVSHYFASFEKEKTRTNLSAYFSGTFHQTNESERIIVTSAARWLGMSVPSELGSVRRPAGRAGGGR